MANRIKFAAFFTFVMSVWALTAGAQEANEIPQLQLDQDISLPEMIHPDVQTESSAPNIEQGQTNSVGASEPPVAALAPSQRITGSLTASAAYVRLNNPSFQFGKFSGVTDSQAYVIGAANVQSQNGVRYWNLKADDIGMDNQSLIFNGGSFGNYKLHFGYSELDNLLSNNSLTPFNGAGGDTLTLSPGFTRAPDTTGMTNLSASMKSVDLGTKRKEGDASFAYEMDKNFGLSFSLRRYLKNGAKSVGTLFRDDGIGPQSMILPEPVHYHTDEFRSGLDWHGERGQANLDYYYSRFTNDDASLTWDNPFTGGTPNPNPNPYPDKGRNSLPPDNQHQRLSLSGSFKLASATRLSALLERGEMTQNEVFLPYTINPNSGGAPVSSVPQTMIPLPRSSADARIGTTLYKLDLTTQPLSAFTLHVGYRHYATDNQTPRNLYQMVTNDGGNQVPRDSHGARYNQPFDSSQNQITLDSSYHFAQGTTFKLGYDLDQKSYRSRAVLSTSEDTYSAKLNKQWNGATAFVNVAYGRKRPDSYDPLRDLENSHTREYLLASGYMFDNLADMRQFDVADRNRQRYGLGMTLLPREDLTIGLNANRNRDQYPASTFGLQEQKTDNYTVDATLTPDEFQSWSLYYTRQNMMWRQTSRAYFEFDRVKQSSNPANDWTAQHRDAIDTVGINITLNFMEDKLPIQLSYAYSNINTDISFTADPTSTINTPPTNMPTLRSKRQTIDLSGTYGIRDDLSVRVGAMMEIYRSSDWATDGLPPGSSAISSDLLTLSGSAAPYRAFVLSTALNYRF